jgi:ABC-2 type transport system permease protein
MLTLVRKDLQVAAGFGWLLAWLVAPSYLVPALAAARGGGVLFWLDVVFATAALVSICLMDACSGADRFIHSLPVTRADVVRGRYGTAVLLGAVSAVLGAVVGVVPVLTSASTAAAWPRWLSADVAAAYVVVMSAVIAVYLPCYFRWGYGRGSVAAALAMAGLIIAGDVAGGAIGAGPLAPRQPGLPAGIVVQAAVAMADSWGTATAGVLAAASASTMLALSAAVSVRWHGRREF